MITESTGLCQSFQLRNMIYIENQMEIKINNKGKPFFLYYNKYLTFDFI